MKSLHNPSPSDLARGGALERLFELAVLLADSMDQGLVERGLTRARAEVLWRLGRLGPMTQRALSEELRCTPRNVTGLVDALERIGLVERRPHPTDRRATLVILTDNGVAASRGMQAEYEHAARDVFADLGADELEEFVAAIDRILGRLRGVASMTDRAS